MTGNNEFATDQLEEASGRWLRDQLREVSDPPAPELLAGDAPPEVEASQLIESMARSLTGAVVEPMQRLEARHEARQRKLEDAVHELSSKMGEAFVETAKLRDQLAAAAARNEEARSQTLRELEELRTQATSEIQELRSQSKNELDAVRARHEAEIEAVRTQYKHEVEAVRAQHKQELEAVSMQAKSAVEAIDVQAKSAAEGLRKDVFHELGQHTEALSDLRASFNTLAEEIGRMQEKVREQYERIDALRFRETQRVKAMNELAKASSSLKEAVAAAVQISSPIDDAVTETQG